jgi:ABC-type phosphate/phosphonate transport system substrate-binding protein
MFGQSLFEILNAESSFILNFGIVVFETLANKLKNKISIVFLNLGSELFRHVTHGYDQINN